MTLLPTAAWCAERTGALLQKGVVDTQLIAHDKEVYDIAWGGVGVFASVSADGSVRVFDLRCVTGCLEWCACMHGVAGGGCGVTAAGRVQAGRRCAQESMRAAWTVTKEDG